MQRIAHYTRRVRELGLSGVIRRAGGRAAAAIGMWGESIRWGLMARLPMSDAALLARTTGGWRTLDALLDHLTARPGRLFLLPHNSLADAAAYTRAHDPARAEAIIAAADAICRGEFAFLGLAFRYSDGIDWQRDPASGYRWPQWHIRRLEGLLWSPGRAADLKPVWELGRCQHFVTLGMAYQLTGDARYRETCAAHLESWIAANPAQFGVHWFSALEVAIRLIAWTIAFQCFRESPEFLRRVGGPFLKSLWQQTDFLSKHLTTTEAVPNNHLIGEATALTLMGAVWPAFRAAESWRGTGLRLLAEQTIAQTHPDGVNAEQATGYHRFVGEFLLAVVALGRRGLLDRSAVLESALRQMMDYALAVQTPDHHAPQWGDSDDGLALGLWQGRDFWDFRPLLAAGAALYEDGDALKWAAGEFDADLFWLLGREGLDAWDRLDAHPPQETSCAFASAGHYILRDSWDAASDVAFFRCGPFGLGGEGQSAHAHCDLLSVQMWIGGRPVLVDSGTYTYFGSERDAFRRNAAHNVVTVDGREQATIRTDFAWVNVPQAECLAWEAGRRVVGAMQTAPGVTWQREVVHPRPGVWEIVDTLEGEGRHAAAWAFHFAPGLKLASAAGDSIWLLAGPDGPTIQVALPAGMRPEVQEGWTSPGYGRRERNAVLRAAWQGDLSGGKVSFCWAFSAISSQHSVVSDRSKPLADG